MSSEPRRLDASSAIPARPTIYNGIQMRSRLEARYAAWLDRLGQAWTYEPQCFATASGQYLPDFYLDNVEILRRPRHTYIDVKPNFATVTSTFARMRVIWESDPDAVLVIDAPHNGDSSSLVGILLPPDLGYAEPLAANWAFCPDDPHRLELALHCSSDRWKVA